MMLGEAQQPDEAIKLLQVGLKGGAGDRETFLSYAQIYERSHRFTEAEAAARKAEALAAQPADNELAWLVLGAIFERQKQYEKAEEEFKKSLAVNPKNGPVLNYYGYMLGDLGQRLDEAADLVKRALKEEPYNGAYLDSMGWIYYRQNKLSEAENTLRQAVDRVLRGHGGGTPWICQIRFCLRRIGRRINRKR